MNQSVMAQLRPKKGLAPKGLLWRAAGRVAEQSETSIPESAQQMVDASGRPLEAETRAFMEARFGFDFSRVRVHTGAQAAASARDVDARAYTVGREIVFADGQYDPASHSGRRLLAHELAHVMQQGDALERGEGEQGFTGGITGHDRAAVEARARQAAARVTTGEAFMPEIAGQAAPGLYAQETNQPEEPHLVLNLPPLSLDWGQLLSPGAFQLPPPTLQLPGFRSRPSLGVPALRPPGSPPPPNPLLQPPGSSTQPLPSYGSTTLTPGVTPNPAFQFPTSQPTGTPAGSTAAPSRLTALSSGRFSLGLRLGFPEAEDIPGAPPSAAQAALQRAEFLNQMITGNIPQGWAAVDKGKLAQAVWGIFSTYIAPDVARNITSKLAGPIGPSGARYGLDLVLLGDFSGGGISFTISH